MVQIDRSKLARAKLTRANKRKRPGGLVVVVCGAVWGQRDRNKARERGTGAPVNKCEHIAQLVCIVIQLAEDYTTNC